MADYFPLLAKAAAGPSGATAQSRQAMYERARKALLAQLRAHDPPAAPEDIERENAALDAAVVRVEAELFPVEPEPAVPDHSVHADSVHAVEDALAPDTAARATPATIAPAVSRDSKSPSDSPTNLGTAAATVVAAGAAAVAGEGTDKTADQTADKIADKTAGTTTGRDDIRPDTDLRLRPRDPQRPLAPTPPAAKRGSARPWIVGGAVAAVVAAVAAAAFTLRESPEDLAKRKPVAVPTAEATGNGKLAERVGGNDAPAVAAAASSTRVNGAAPAPTVTQAPIPIATRSALLVQAPDLESKIRTFTGSSVWRLDNVPAASGPLGTAVHADVDLPEAKVRLTIDIRKNTDPALPAANTIEIRFTLGAGSALPGIEQIGPPQMRREESPNGDALSGVPVKITDTYFLVGLAQGEVEKRNADLLRSRGWFDIPIQLSDSRIAKLTVEKGGNGDRIIADALSNWAQ